MRPIASATIILAVALSAPRATQAQRIGEVQLKMGASRSEVFSLLMRHFQVDTVGVVIVREPGPSGRIAGSVGFTDGALTFVSQDWAMPYADAQSFALAVVHALSQLEREGGCAIETRRDVAPAQEYEVVKVKCGIHSISIIAGRSVNGSTTPGVSEAWSSR